MAKIITYIVLVFILTAVAIFLDLNGTPKNNILAALQITFYVFLRIASFVFAILAVIKYIKEYLD